MCETAKIGDDLLTWYDAHARVLPWRVPPGTDIKPDPYLIWLSEVMLQQTTVAAVKSYFETFTTRWPTVRDLAAAEDADVMAAWAGLGYYARARNLLKCARVVTEAYGGAFPDTEEALLTLPGIGPYTAAAIAAIAFDRPAVVMDGNIERVMARLFALDTPLPAAKPCLRDHAASLTPDQRPGDHAQALMDLGATICTPRNPACGICCLRDPCKARAVGNAAELPRKAPKKAKPVRRGIAYFVQRSDGAVLLETRPETGLLGGMLGLPGTDWSDDPAAAPPIRADWQILPQAVRHTFTHFHLILDLWLTQSDSAVQPDRGTFYQNPDPADLPTVMRKAFLAGMKGLHSSVTAD
ncbi:A/G-specific adenine glycosylase [Halovulum sp. GXIMD14793]